MDRARDYFVGERYRGLAARATWPEEAEAIVGPDLDVALARAPHPESDPLEFSQELLFSLDDDARRRFAAGDIRFPFYSRAGSDVGWKALRTQAPFVETLARALPDLPVPIIEQLWVERARGTPRAIPGPHDRRGRWRAGSTWMADLHPLGVRPGAYAAAFVTPRHGIGGGEKTMHELAAAFERLTGRPSLIIVADAPAAAADLPPGVVCLPDLRIRGEAFLRLTPTARVEILGDLLIGAGVPRVLAMNSHLTNLLFQTGRLQDARVACASVLFCIGRGLGGAAEGYIRIADWLIDDGVVLFTDNDAMARVLADQFFYDDTVVLAMPAQATAEPIPSGPHVLWAGRIDDQKRPDLLVDAAAAAPALAFDVWGTPVLSDSAIMRRLTDCPNIRYRGGFTEFAQIDLTNVGCLMYTSDYDGTPNLLLEAMGRGLPCLCSAVGGVPDLMADGRGALMRPDASADDWAAALRRLLSAEAERRSMAAAAREHIRVEHSQEAFDRTAARLLAAL